MNGLSFTRGIVIALGLALVSSVAVTVLSGTLHFQDLIRLLVPVLSFAHLLSISRFRRRRSGWASCLMLWFGFALCLWWSVPWTIEYLILHVVVLSVVRAVFFHKTLVSVFFDVGLSLFGLGAAFWALSHSGSVFLTTWCFFLFQAAIIAMLGDGSTTKSHFSASKNTTEFDVALRKAEEALRQLTTK